MKFKIKYLAKKYNLNSTDVVNMSKICEINKKLPDGYYRTTEYSDGYNIDYYWENSEGWITDRLSIFRIY